LKLEFFVYRVRGIKEGEGTEGKRSGVTSRGRGVVEADNFLPGSGTDT